MKYVVFLVGAILLVGATASAQEEASATTAPEAAAEPTSAQEPPKEEEKKRSPYYKKVKGWLWLEGFAGPSSYDPDQFAFSFGTVGNAPKRKGPSYGFAIGTGFGGGFFLGWYYRQADYTEYKLMKTGLEFQPTIRIPYVHIAFRIDIGFARMFGGNPYMLTNMDSGGVDTTFGVGLRIPIVRWMSFVATFDWSYIGLSMRGNDPSGNRVDSWISGQQLTGTFGLTFHFIGVRKD
jgi:hypothetical protein